MSLKVSDQVPPVGTKLVVETDADETARVSVTGSAGAIFQVEVDNTGNGDHAAYLKIYDNASPVVGTTAPDYIFKVPTTSRLSFVCPDGMSFIDLSFAVVTTGGTGGVVGPTNPVIVKFVTS